MTILENRMLMSMEAINKLASGHAKFRISGDIMEYNGRNYILIVKAVALPDAQPEAIKAR